VLVAEFARVRARLDMRAGDAAVSEPGGRAVDDARALLPAPAAIDRLCELFGLTPFERDVLLLSAGVQMDAQLAACCMRATSDAQRPGPTFGLALAAMASPHWSALTPARPLRRWRLVELEGGGVTDALLRIDERVLHFLAGIDGPDVRLQPLLRALPPDGPLAPSHQRLAARICATIESLPSPLPVIVLTGDDPVAQGDVGAAVADRLGFRLQSMRADDVPAAAADLHLLATLCERDALLSVQALMIDARDGVTPPALRLAGMLRGLVMVGCARPIALDRSSAVFEVECPDPAEQRVLWRRALQRGDAPLPATIEAGIDAVAGQFQLGARAIEARALRAADDPAPDALWRACRVAARARLDDLAQRVDARAGWDDLVLPPAPLATLHAIAAQCRQRMRVHEDWGFATAGARGLGVSVLFAGASGTGKTLAAEVLACDLGLDLYRIDLSAVVDKYIGETEKNLRRVFDAAEEGSAVLLFDEADALFGKRSEVKDSHDRYANLEVSYLLQRMETYRGLAILTSNLKGSLDDAFHRRLRFVVQFPFPDQTLREALWRRAFPPRTPLDGVNPSNLARLDASGGSIRNIALNAAFAAAAEGGAVSMRHLLRAAHAEAAKRERPLSDAETRGWT